MDYHGQSSGWLGLFGGRTHRWILLYIFIFAFLPVKAQIRAAEIRDPSLELADLADLSVEIWGPEEGLPQSSVTSIIQDGRGYLWIGTLEGVARFDGYRFTTHGDSSTPLLPGEPTTVLALDPDQGVWVGTLGNGVHSVDLDGHASAWDLPRLVDDRVYAILPQGAGRALLGTGYGLVDARESGAPKVWNQSHGLPHSNVIALAPGDNDNVWVGTTGGLVTWNSSGVERPDFAQQLDSVPIRTLERGEDGRLWIGTLGSGVGLWEDGRYTVIGPDEGLSNLFVSDLLEVDGCLWIGTRGGLFRRCGSTLEAFPSDHLLAQVTVLALHRDREGSLWVGSQTKGLLRIHQQIVDSLTPKEGLGDAMVSSVSQRRDGTILVGTTGRGVTVLNEDGPQILDVSTGLPTNRVTAVLEGSGGELWIGTSGKGLVEWTIGDIRTHDVANDALASDFVLALFEDRMGGLWVGTNTGGVSRRQENQWETWGKEDGLPANAVMAFAQNLEGTLFIATQRGLVQRKIGEDSYRVIPLPYSLLTSLLVDSEGRLWVGTLGGGIFVQDGEQFLRISKANGLPSNTVWSLLEGNGDLWMSSNHGIWKVSPEELLTAARGEQDLAPIHLLGKAEGLPSSECNGGTQPAAWRTDDGRLLFATLEGVAVVDPKTLPNETPEPPTVVESVRADGVTLAPGSRIKVPPGTRSLEVDYSALTFRAANQVRFRYRLQGYDDHWIEAGSRRTAFFTGVPPGSYHFNVQAGSGSEWGEELASQALIFTPRWHQTLGFRWTLGCLVLLFIVAVPLQRHRQVEMRRRHLEFVVAERTKALSAANERLQELADRDGLTGLANRRLFDQRLESEWSRSGRTGRPLAIVMGDVDFFKRYNDALGHIAGDHCLQKIAKVFLQAARRNSDLAARYGGEELVLLLPETELRGALHLAEEIRESVEACQIRHPDSPAGEVVTISLGVTAVHPTALDSAESVVHRADQALYRAKEQGRSRVEPYEAC